MGKLSERPETPSGSFYFWLADVGYSACSSKMPFGVCSEMRWVTGMGGSAIKRIDLLRLVLFVAIASGLLTLVNAFYASYQVQRQQLVESSLESNFNYAKKLASSTDDFIRSAQQQLAVSARLLSSSLHERAKLEGEAERLRTQTDSFNSVLILDRNGEVLAASPETLQVVGQTITTPGVRHALKARESNVSEPYLSTAGNFIVFISQPIKSASGEYLGLVGGSLYLKQESILNHMLGKHYYRDGSYLYVVASNKQIIYHPDPARIGDIVLGNSVIDRVIGGGSGSQAVVNSKGIEMLAGYAPISLVGWGVVAQRPVSAALAPLDGLMRQVAYKILPVTLISLLLVWWCARKISEPLRLLAVNARNMHAYESEEEIKKIHSWYFESYELKKALLLGMGFLKKNIEKLNKDVRTDPLTGLGNRRSLEAGLERCERQNLPFSVISMDIDHFKSVNDMHGHDVGDLVLRIVTGSMKNAFREIDVPCRVGGEEFLILLPETNRDTAHKVAERLRKQIESTDMPKVGHVTISLGVASWPSDSEDIATVLKIADEMLYKAKRNGRNRVEAFRATEEGVLSQPEL